MVYHVNNVARKYKFPMKEEDYMMSVSLHY